jgi:outer membrane protein assembly factor BamB
VSNRWNPEKFGYRFGQFNSSYQSEAPWPSMRADIRNSGCLNDLKFIKHPNATKEVHHFRTGNAIFSTPIIGKNEIIYVGSADHKFYAFDPHKEVELWSDEYGEIVDSAGCIDKDGTVYIAAGDAKIHAYDPNGKEKWQYNALENRPKQQFSFSSNFWFEANIVLGPDGALYVANDDFFLYKMTLSGEIIWGFRTGFLIWSAACFWSDKTVFIAGFDHLLYAIDSDTGKLKWKKDLKGSMVSSPAIGEDGTLYQGSFNGNIYAVNSPNGAVKWVFKTGSHIYSSPAIAPDNTIYIGSTNGMFYAIDCKSGSQKWTFYIGDAIRSSASIGPDPEAKQPYLIYLGGGDGRVYALDPQGNLRWSYNTLLKAMNTDYPNINASIALGHTGLTIASSTGDVIWIPYDYYLNKDAEGILLGAVFNPALRGEKWHFMTPGGRLMVEPLETSQEILPVNNISIRLLMHNQGKVDPAEIIPKSIEITAKPSFKFRFELQSNNNIMNIVPEEILLPGSDYELKISTDYLLGNTQGHSDSLLHIKTKPAPKQTQIIKASDTLHKIVYMAIPQPTIVPSLNQIGFASLNIPFMVADIDKTQKKFIAWAVQKFGEEGVPQKRISTYAFSGRFQDDYYMMDAKNCLFEITSFNIPLNLFRIAGLIKPDGTSEGGNLIVEKHWGTQMLKLLREMGSTSPITMSMMMSHLRKVGFGEFMRALGPFVRALYRQMSRNMWETWKLVNHRHHFMGVGTYKLAVYPDKRDSLLKGIEVDNLVFLAEKRQIMATIKNPNEIEEWVVPLRIILVDIASFEVIPINYSNATKQLSKDGISKVILTIPKEFSLRKGLTRAHLMGYLSKLKTIDF